jgi:hypothetical protein
MSPYFMTDSRLRCSFVNDDSSDTPNDLLLNYDARHSPVPQNKCIINNIRSHSLESFAIFSLAYKSRAIALINPYSSAIFINSYTSQHLTQMTLAVRRITPMRQRERLPVLLLLKRQRKRTGCT